MGLPSIALSSLHWGEMVRHYMGDMPEGTPSLELRAPSRGSAGNGLVKGDQTHGIQSKHMRASSWEGRFSLRAKGIERPSANAAGFASSIVGDLRYGWLGREPSAAIEAIQLAGFNRGIDAAFTGRTP